MKHENVKTDTPRSRAALLRYLKKRPNLNCTRHPLAHLLGPVTVGKVQHNGLRLDRANGLSTWLHWDRTKALFSFDGRGFEVCQAGLDWLRYEYEELPG